MRDLRISVIDRCNLRCSFCMPGDREYSFLPRNELLTFEETTRLARIFLRLGVRKIRLTGGEPLLRTEIEKLVAMLAALEGLEDLALTTNGILLASRARALRDAGLNRVTVSFQSLDDAVATRINGRDVAVDAVLRGIDEAAAVGLAPVKINVVVMKGVNDAEVPAIARLFKEKGHVVRFIEYMDVGTLNDWDPERVLSADRILQGVAREMPLEPVKRAHPSDVALRFRYRDDGLEVGAIASVTQPFCGDCSRVRLSSDGQLFTCLFAQRGVDLKAPLRAGADEKDLESLVRSAWGERKDRYSEERTSALHQGLPLAASPKVEMFRIGG